MNPLSDAGKFVHIWHRQDDLFPDDIKVQVITWFETSDALALACF